MGRVKNLLIRVYGLIVEKLPESITDEVVSVSNLAVEKEGFDLFSLLCYSPFLFEI